MPDPLMADPDVLDADDVRIVRALQVAPRGSFAAIAAALATTEATVRRRYRRLRSQGVVRVTGVVDPGALGQGRWLVRLRCRPGSAVAVGEALARRPDVSWVGLTDGGSEVTCAVRSWTPRARDDLLGHQLPRTAAVLDLSAAVVLRQFVGGRAHHWAALAGTLTSEQERRLGGTRVPFTEAPVVAPTPARLDDADRALLALLATDGRASLVDLGAAAGLSAPRAARRLDALLAARVVALDVELSAEALGRHARANLWLRVHPASVSEAGRALAARPEIAFAAAISGPHNLTAVAQCRDLDELYALTSDDLGALPGLQSLEVSPLLRHLKQIDTRVEHGRLVDPN